MKCKAWAVVSPKGKIRGTGTTMAQALCNAIAVRPVNSPYIATPYVTGLNSEAIKRGWRLVRCTVEVDE